MLLLPALDAGPREAWEGDTQKTVWAWNVKKVTITDPVLASSPPVGEKRAQHCLFFLGMPSVTLQAQPPALSPFLPTSVLRHLL